VRKSGAPVGRYGQQTLAANNAALSLTSRRPAGALSCSERPVASVLRLDGRVQIPRRLVHRSIPTRLHGWDQVRFRVTS
jgi:hypothetical protein